MTTGAFFDLDKTIIAKSSTLAFTRPLYRAGFLGGSTLAKAGIAQAYYRAVGADHPQLERGRLRERVVFDWPDHICVVFHSEKASYPRNGLDADVQEADKVLLVRWLRANWRSLQDSGN